MVAARSAAMGFNRLADASYDALNPRTASREIPRGVMSRGEAAIFITVVVRRVRLCGVEAWNDLLRAVARGSGDRLLVLAREARHELHAAVSRPGDGCRAGRRLARGRRTRWHRAVAPGSRDRDLGRRLRRALRLQDLDFDRAHGLRSIPVRFGVARAARHLAGHARHHRACALRCSGLLRTWAGCISRAWPASAALLVFEQSLVSEQDLSQVKRAFDLNGYVGILYLVTTAAAIYVR